jgi:hypothetical protein
VLRQNEESYTKYSKKNVYTNTRRTVIKGQRRVEEALFIKQRYLMEMPVNDGGGDYDDLLLRGI